MENRYRYGHFNSSGEEFTVTAPDTPRSFDNFLWNDTVMSNVQQTGVGYMDYRVDHLEAIQLFTGNGRICDYDVFGRDSLMSRLVYIRDKESGDFWNTNWEPVCAPYEEFACTHGLGYTVIENKTRGIASRLRLFVPSGKDPVELWTLTVRNTEPKPRRLSLFLYSQFQFRYKWGFDSYGDMLFRSSAFHSEHNAVIVRKQPYYRPHDYLNAFITSDYPIIAFDGVREAFTGLYGSLSAPRALKEGRLSNTPGTADSTIAAIQLELDLAPGEEKTLSFMLGVVAQDQEIAPLKEKYLGRFDSFFQQMREQRQAVGKALLVHTPDPHLDRLMNHWLKNQCLFEADWCRWGWNGYRDIVQHGMGVSSITPKRTGEILLEALRYQYADGLALRGWDPVDTKPYSDNALWLVFTLTAYCRETEDLAFLEEMVPFYDRDEGTVLEHIDRALDFLESHKGTHGLCLIKFGDWNDSLTAVGKEGKGESVWLSQAYGEALRRMEELALRMERSQRAEEYKARYERISEAVNLEAWDGQWYVRCFDDGGNRVGSSLNRQGQIFGESQSWAMISGMANAERTEKLMQSSGQLLATPQGYRLLAPTFTERDDNVGRLSCMQPGICENGTIYSHVNAWYILGLLRSGRVQEAYELFCKITPGYAEENSPRKQDTPPYVFANCYFGPDHVNNAFQTEFTWVTGSIAWFFTLIQEELLGIRPVFDGLDINPRIPEGWKSYNVRRDFQGAVYDISFQNPCGLSEGTVRLKMDGALIPGSKIPSMRDGQTHSIEATLVEKS